MRTHIKLKSASVLYKLIKFVLNTLSSHSKQTLIYIHSSLYSSLTPTKTRIPSKKMSHARFKSAPANRTKRETNSVAITCGEEQMKNVFGRSDSDKDGYLSKQELKKAFSDLGVEFPSLRAMSALWHADDNGDNYISKKELAELVKYTSTMNTCTNK